MTAKRIIVGYDRSPEAKFAAAWALDEAARTGAPVELFYAYEWPEWAPAASMTPAPAIWPDGETDRARTGSFALGFLEERPVVAEQIVKDEQRALEDFVAGWREKFPDVQVSATYVTGHPADALTAASNDAQLVVVGTRGHGALRGMLLGSVSQHLLHRSPCAVAVIREMNGASS
jgi:nucleotide-binding universal stress UspA family protein